MARLSEQGIRLSSMSPSFLNSNSTSHAWPFSAVAELIDNASDPGVTAKQIWIDVVDEAGQLYLTFTDNGGGMTPNKLHKMLSFGFTDKGSGRSSQQAIGVYGNGFKSGSMRLGRDALIFTKNGGCQTVGMLSQTYLEEVKAQAIIVPIVPFSQTTNSLVVTEDSEASLAAILKHSLVTSHEQIHAHFDSIPSKKGTKILIWNIRRAQDEKPEFDFETDGSDIRLPEIQIEELKKCLKTSGSLRAEQNIPDMHYSLRAYVSILYLKPRTQIFLRGKKVLTKLVSKRLLHMEHDVYKPNFSKEKVKVTFGLCPKNKEHHGIMMYHKNRLIKAYEKVGCQLKSSGQRGGVGVIGILECSFLKPAHNKQDFEYTKEYRLTLSALGLKLNDYWKAVVAKKAREREFQALNSEDEIEEEQDADEGPLWLQCGECLKWRSVPVFHYSVVPESWDCSQNPNPRYRSCSSPEEPEENEKLSIPSYRRKHMKQEPRSRKEETSKEVNEEAGHRIPSRCSSETCRSAHTPATVGHIEESTQEQDQTNAFTHVKDDDDKTQVTAEVAHIQDKPVGREGVTEDQTPITHGHMEKGTNTVSCEESENHKTRDESWEPVERDGKSTQALSSKRKSGSSFYSPKKKPRLWDRPQPDLQETAEELHPEKTQQDSSSEVEKRDDAARQTSSSVMLSQHGSQLSPTVGLQSRPLPPEGRDREAELERLAGLEKEARLLRTLLGLEITTSTQGTMTMAAGSPPQPPSKETREVACQASVFECSTSPGGHADRAHRQERLLTNTGCGWKEQFELKGPLKEKSETQGKIRVGDSQARGLEDSRSAQENLHSIRSNVVVLLTAILPQLDLTGINSDTADIDDILQQIIEANSLKL